MGVRRLRESVLDELDKRTVTEMLDKLVSGELTIRLNSPLTEEQWDMIADTEFDHTKNIWFTTKHGKMVEFVKVVRCKDCKHYALSEYNTFGIYVCKKRGGVVGENDYCSRAEEGET